MGQSQGRSVAGALAIRTILASQTKQHHSVCDLNLYAIMPTAYWRLNGAAQSPFVPAASAPVKVWRNLVCARLATCTVFPAKKTE